MIALRPAYDQLTPVERQFVDGYVLRVEQAAVQTGEGLAAALSRPLPGEHVAAAKGLLDRPMVIAAVYGEIKRKVDLAELTPERLVQEYQAIAFSNLKDYFDIDGAGQPDLRLEHATREQWSALSEVVVEYHTNGMVRSTKVKLHSKMDALSKLGEMMAVLYRDNEYWKTRQASTTVTDDSVDSKRPAGDRYARMIASQG